MIRSPAYREAKAVIREENRVARKASKKAAPVVKPTRGRELDKGFLIYLRRQPCEARGLGGCDGRIDPAHIRYNDGPNRLNPGAGRKNHDRHCNALCRTHHDMQHSMDERRFWSLFGKDAYATAEAQYAAYQSPRPSRVGTGTGETMEREQ